MISKLEVVAGESETIQCHASGKPPPTYQWIRSATSLNLGASSDRFTAVSYTHLDVYKRQPLLPCTVQVR